ncbi:hypothetical protein Hanom_Chr15g01393001 [Helianthus anomalus]
MGGGFYPDGDDDERWWWWFEQAVIGKKSWRSEWRWLRVEFAAVVFERGEGRTVVVKACYCFRKGELAAHTKRLDWNTGMNIIAAGVARGSEYLHDN